MGGPGPKSQERAGGAKWGQVGPEGLGNGLEGLGRGPEVWRVPFGGAEWVLGKANAAQKRGEKKNKKTLSQQVPTSQLSQNKFKIPAGKAITG